jgi:hypothetical protein
MFINCGVPCKRQLLCLSVSSVGTSFFSIASHRQVHLCWALPQPPVGLWWGRQGFGPCLGPGKQPSLHGLSRVCFKGHLCLCLSFRYPLQMSAWTLPSVAWQFSGPNCLIAPLKCVLSWFWLLCVSLCLYLLFPFISNSIACFPYFKKIVRGASVYYKSNTVCGFWKIKNGRH